LVRLRSCARANGQHRAGIKRSPHFAFFPAFGFASQTPTPPSFYLEKCEEHMKAKPKTRRAAAASVRKPAAIGDPIFELIAEHKALMKKHDLYEANFRAAKSQADEKYGKSREGMLQAAADTKLLMIGGATPNLPHAKRVADGPDEAGDLPA
jgi:hypothetical protein